jgi:hypothetical protein
MIELFSGVGGFVYLTGTIIFTKSNSIDDG